MARLLLVNKAVEGQRTKGDIVDYYDDGKFFPPNIFESFDVMEMPPFTKEQLAVELEKKAPEKTTIWKSKTIEWTNVRPEDKAAWKNEQDEWCFLEERGDTLFTLRDMKANDRATLEDVAVDIDIKRLLLAGIAQETISLHPENLDKVDKLVEI